MSEPSQSLLFTYLCIFIYTFFLLWPSLKHKCCLRREAVLWSFDLRSFNQLCFDQTSYDQSSFDHSTAPRSILAAQIHDVHITSCLPFFVDQLSRQRLVHHAFIQEEQGFKRRFWPPSKKHFVRLDILWSWFAGFLLGGPNARASGSRPDVVPFHDEDHRCRASIHVDAFWAWNFQVCVSSQCSF